MSAIKIKLTALEYGALPSDEAKSSYEVTADGDYTLKGVVSKEDLDTQIKAAVQNTLKSAKDNAAAELAAAKAKHEAEIAALKAGKPKDNKDDNKDDNPAVKELQETLARLQGELKTRDEKIVSEQNFNAISAEIAKNSTIRKEAHSDVIRQAQEKGFVADNGALIVKNENGNPVLNQASGQNYSFSDFLGELQTSAPHYFGENKGGGAQGNQTPSTIAGAYEVKRTDHEAVGKAALAGDLDSGKAVLVD